MEDMNTHRQTGVDDGLFLERLDAFMDRSLVDLEAFAQRERRPFQEIRRFAAEWHSRYLFSPPADGPITESKAERVRRILLSVSRTLEGLHSVVGVHSFFLAVDPAAADHQSFLGGTVLGREFWRGLRGGGITGAQLFSAQAARQAQGVPSPGNASTSTAPPPAVRPVAAAKKGPAGTLKADVYASVRDALRTASGIRTAEMKWTNHERLAVYEVQIEGWPADIPPRNPSTLSTAQNKRIQAALQNGAMRFVPKEDGPSGLGERPLRSNDETEEDPGGLSAWLVDAEDLPPEGSVASDRSSTSVGPNGRAYQSRDSNKSDSGTSGYHLSVDDVPSQKKRRIGQS